MSLRVELGVCGAWRSPASALTHLPLRLAVRLFWALLLVADGSDKPELLQHGGSSSLVFELCAIQPRPVLSNARVCCRNQEKTTTPKFRCHQKRRWWDERPLRPVINITPNLFLGAKTKTGRRAQLHSCFALLFTMPLHTEKTHK